VVSGQIHAPAALLREKGKWYSLDRSLIGLQSQSGRSAEEKRKCMSYRESNPGRPTRSIATIHRDCNGSDYRKDSDTETINVSPPRRVRYGLHGGVAMGGGGILWAVSCARQRGEVWHGSSVVQSHNIIKECVYIYRAISWFTVSSWPCVNSFTSAGML
jgi:hypothetical protein